MSIFDPDLGDTVPLDIADLGKSIATDPEALQQAVSEGRVKIIHDGGVMDVPPTTKISMEDSDA